MKQYLPILKSKRGEFKSLTALNPNHKNRIIPVIELLEGFAELTYQQLSEIWTFDKNEIIIDSSYFSNSGGRAVDYINLLERLNTAGVRAIPVLEPDSSNHLIHLVDGFAYKHTSKLCIRIRRDFLVGSEGGEYLLKLLAKTTTKSMDIVLLLDNELITAMNLKIQINKTESFLNELKDPLRYSLIAVASGSFPENLGKIEAGTIKQLPRLEQLIWESISSKFKFSNLIYGDYGIKHPLIDPSTTPFEGTCSIKYTTKEDYVIFRGIRSSDLPKGSAQYHEKCKLLIAHHLYDGKLFSWADSEIHHCAMRVTKPGNAESWVKIGHNHHFAKILSLL